jgi:hypothetical protein
LIGFSKRRRKMERHRRGERDKQKNVKTERCRDRQEEKQNTNWQSDWETGMNRQKMKRHKHID